MTHKRQSSANAFRDAERPGLMLYQRLHYAVARVQFLETEPEIPSSLRRQARKAFRSASEAVDELMQMTFLDYPDLVATGSRRAERLVNKLSVTVSCAQPLLTDSGLSDEKRLHVRRLSRSADGARNVVSRWISEGVDQRELFGYEGGVTHEEPWPMAEPEKEQQLLSARDIADNEGVPLRLLVDAVRHGFIPVSAAAAERMAALYKTLRDGEPPPPRADAAEVSFARQAVETLRRDNEQRRAWTEEHPRKRTDYQRDYMRKRRREQAEGEQGDTTPQR